MHVAVERLGKFSRLSTEVIVEKIICIEGPDNIGKSTLCEELSELYPDAEQFHLGAPKKKGELALKEQLKTLDDVLERVDKNKSMEIWDRSIIGESVYGPIFRQYDHKTYWHELKKAVRRLEDRMLLIVLYADELTYSKWNIKPKSDETLPYQKSTFAKRISEEFVNVATQLDLRNTLYINCNNYETMDARNAYIIRRIKRWVAGKRFYYSKTGTYQESFFNREQRMWVNGFYENRFFCRSFKNEECSIGENHRQLRVIGGGDAYPIGAVGGLVYVKYIFIGESAGYQPDHDQLLIPFYNGISGQIFQAALDKIGVHPTQYYLTNVVKCNPRSNHIEGHCPNGDYIRMYECTKGLEKEIQQVIEISKLPVKVVTIGKIADEVLTEMKIPHVKVLHPAYYSRFGNSDEFIKKLEQAVNGADWRTA